MASIASTWRSSARSSPLSSIRRSPGGRRSPPPAPPRRIVAGAIAGYVAINAAALAEGFEFGVQPLLFHDATGAPLYAPYPLSVAVPAMMLAHLTLAGAAEAI